MYSVSCAQNHEAKEAEMTDWVIDHLKGQVKSVSIAKYNIVVDKNSHSESYLRDSSVIHYTSSGFRSEKRLDQTDSKVKSLINAGKTVSDSKGYKKYDAQGNCVEINNAESHCYYTYDDAGNMLSSDCEELQFHTRAQSLYQYDFKNREVASQNYRGKVETGSSTFKYNEQNSLIEQVNKFETRIDSTKFTFGYDEYGNMTWEKNYASRQFPNAAEGGHTTLWFTYKYKYDSHGNWLQKRSYSFDEPFEIINRIIEYY